MGIRNRGARVWVILGVAVVALALAVPAFGALGSTPSKECSSSTWNGKYWKAEIGISFSIKSIESNVATTLITLSIDQYQNATWSLDSSSDHAVFRIYEKGGKYNQVNEGFWLPGQGGTFSVEESISHITFCLTDIPDPKVSITKTTNGSDPSASDPNYIRSGQPVTWEYVVKNTGSVSLEDIVVTDDREGTIGTHSGPLDPGKTLTFTKEAAGGAELSAYPNGYSNLATVTAKSKTDGSSVEASDTSGYYGAQPSISILVDGPDGPVLLGSTFQWVFTVENTGNVPLSGVVVTENDVTVGNCSLGVLLPDAVATCTLTETATPGQETSTFVVKGIFDDGEAENVVSQITGALTYEINQPPVATDDTYETPDRGLGGPSTLIVDAADGVLANDTDPDDDVLSASDPTDPTNEGSVTLNADGSFSYTPSPAYAWAADEFSRVDTFDYVASDGRGGTDVGTVSITVNRVVCVGESVADADGAVEGVFTLLETTNDPCKHYQVDAQSETPTGELVTLEIPGDDSNPSLFRGLLTFSPESLTPEGELILGVEYDPDLRDGVQLRTLPVCVDPVFEDGLIVDATLPQENAGVVDTWCLAGLVGMATGAGGEVEVTYQAIGLEDPGFSAR